LIPDVSLEPLRVIEFNIKRWLILLNSKYRCFIRISVPF
jgi:hypothetical protein